MRPPVSLACGAVGRGSAPSESPASWIDGWATNDETALWFEGAEVTYATLARRIDEVAAALVELGVSSGDRVSWVGLNRVELFEVLFACARIGAIFNPLNNRLTARELGALVDAAAPTVILTTDGFGDTVAQAVVVAGSKASVRDLDVQPLRCHAGRSIDRKPARAANGAPFRFISVCSFLP